MDTSDTPTDDRLKTDSTAMWSDNICVTSDVSQSRVESCDTVAENRTVAPVDTVSAMELSVARDDTQSRIDSSLISNQSRPEVALSVALDESHSRLELSVRPDDTESAMESSIIVDDSHLKVHSTVLSDDNQPPMDFSTVTNGNTLPTNSSIIPDDSQSQMESCVSQSEIQSKADTQDNYLPLDSSVSLIDSQPVTEFSDDTAKSAESATLHDPLHYGSGSLIRVSATQSVNNSITSVADSSKSCKQVEPDPQQVIWIDDDDDEDYEDEDDGFGDSSAHGSYSELGEAARKRQCTNVGSYAELSVSEDSDDNGQTSAERRRQRGLDLSGSLKNGRPKVPRTRRVGQLLFHLCCLQ